MKTFFAIAATLVGTAAFVPYLKDIVELKTKPHFYTWLIWSITLGTSAAGIWYGGGGWGGLNLTVGFLLALVVVLFSLKYGITNIRRSDTVVLTIAAVGILISWRLRQPLPAVILASVIDFLGYLPTFRKSYEQPWDETLITWFAFTFSAIFSILGLREYNLLTTFYLVTITCANIILLAICLRRRPLVPKPAPAT
ncbi:MAG TPA: hypothetical protein VI756_24025 [Blastocatellia bacterium]